ncbi:MAG: spermidine synthase [Desulfobacterium sp.]|nr:spermidine synthase [Desulfobacterium sp.]MBU3947369.1 fused MFS/spermidine synthase [Pseudomonadota bacterium]MBU4037189.1 fused MFS/spermidine synthase [Pseudomonadota bacterium]
MNKYRLEIIVFITGAVVMALELVGSRIVAPYLGTSIYVWTSLIGVILASLSVGYYWGGRLADKKLGYKTFSILIFFCALLVGIIAIIKTPVLDIVSKSVPDVRLGAVIAATILFAPASILLGSVSPYAIRLRMEDIAHSGATVGRLYAISTAGSIIGTFSTGFFLISFLGSRNILFFLSFVLFIVYFLACFENKLRAAKAAAIVLTAGFLSVYFFQSSVSGNAIADIDTKYNRVLIEEMKDSNTGKTIRFLRVDRSWAQSAVVVGEPDELFFSYAKFYRLIEHFCPENKNALLIGGGAYTVARDYLRRNPDNSIDVIEIDPDFTLLAKKYFYLKDDPRIRSIHEDGRTFLKRATKKYDVIFIDVFKSSASPPFYMTTEEAMQESSALLNDKGVLITNIYSAIQGEKGKFFRAAYATIKSVFPNVYIFPVQYPMQPEELQNLIIVAIKSGRADKLTSSDPEQNIYLSHCWQHKIDCDIPVLRDEFAPVEHYLAEVIKAL